MTIDTNYNVSKVKIDEAKQLAQSKATEQSTDVSIFGSDTVMDEATDYGSDALHATMTANQLRIMLSTLIRSVSQIDENTSDISIQGLKTQMDIIRSLAGDEIDVNQLAQDAIKGLTPESKAKVAEILGLHEADTAEYNFAPVTPFDNVLRTFAQPVQNAIVGTQNAINTAKSDPTIGTFKATENGLKLANVASETAKSMGSHGWCLKGVNNSLEKMYGFRLSYPSAYMAADALAKKTDQFTEMKYNKEDLANLPAGAIVVWDKDGDNPHGHISIALGNGYEASDHVNKQYKNISNSFRVFIPN